MSDYSGGEAETVRRRSGDGAAATTSLHVATWGFARVYEFG